MRTKIMIILSVLIIAVFNYSIYDKEQIIANGEIVLLELAPVDPRSLMQGDYMILRYAIERNAPAEELPANEKRGYMVISTDENNVAQFARFHKDEKLADNEILLRFHKKYNSVNIVPNSFFFQEGHAKYYDNARYGIFKFDGSGNYLLIGLADKNREEIRVNL